MNPPPYQPPEENKKTLVRQILLASLIALPVLALIIFLGIYAVAAQKKAIQTRAAVQDINASEKEIRADLKKNFDPKVGFTNMNLEGLDKLQTALKNASEKSSGDDSIVATAMSAYVARMQIAAKNYQTAVARLQEAHVLALFDPSNKGQLATRREFVLGFLDANAALKQVITNSEDRLRADLTATKLSPAKIDSYVEQFHSSTISEKILTTKIRQCDERIGAALLDALNTLESDWGHWKSDDAKGGIIFERTAARDAYNKAIKSLQTAADEQVKLQAKLINQPAPPQP
jgi:translation initiation factor 2 alpha subunit (eIF-2alpha)